MPGPVGDAAAAFDRAARDYDRWCATPLGAAVERAERASLRRLLARTVGTELRGLRALDVGCGTGSWALELASRGAQVAGVDASAAMVAVARAKAAATPDAAARSVEFRVARAEALPFASGVFDLVTALFVLEFVPQPEAAVREMARVLRPGGWAVVGALNRWSPWAWWRRARAWFAPSVYRHARFPSLGEVERWLRTGGLLPAARAGAVHFPPLASPWLLARADALERVGARLAPAAAACVLVAARKPA